METKNAKSNQSKKKNTTQEKKQTNKKKTENKEITKEKKSQNNKNISEKKQEKNQNNKETKKITSEKILMIVFVILSIVVVILGILVFIKSKEHIEVNMVIPIVEKGSEMEFSIDLVSLKKEKEYIFKIVNYRNNEVISENIPYTITVENNSDSKIKLTRNDSKNDLMKEQSSTVLNSLKVYKDEKQEIYFHITLEKSGNIKEKELINIKIES